MTILHEACILNLEISLSLYRIYRNSSIQAPISTDTQEAESKKRPYLSKNVFIYIINILPIQIVIPLDAPHSKYHNLDQPLQVFSLDR